MKSNYKKIGNHIRDVNVRNSELKTNTLLGINIDKYYMPSVANIVGTDLTAYKVVKAGQFACNRMHVGRDYRLPVALSRSKKDFIVSPAYDVFEIIDKEVLIPEYLMMWFSRKEFDRNAWFFTDADVRGGLPWESFCEMDLPIPHPNKQKEIVKEYNTIVNHIALNNRLIQKLEETAQTIYKQWFVDFEFPDENGKPYKSNGGEMEFNEELQKKIPKGWGNAEIIKFSKDIVCGKTPPTDDEENYGDYMPFLTIPDMHDKVFAIETERRLSVKGVNTQKNKTLPPNSICVSCIGTAGLVVVTSEKCQTNQQINSVICKDDTSYCFMYFALKDLEQKIQEWGNKGSVGINMNKTEFSALMLLKPSPIHMKYLAPFHFKWVTLFYCSPVSP
ncbi:MAG: restriction endonuclease subunit S [Proteobacteria bacterium]|nr:restriction endonuclease subunit S [Pseudomonadota bacterium]